MSNSLPSMADGLPAVVKAIKKGRTFFVAGHQNPDGDTIGCGLCMASVLRRLGKKAFIYSSDPIPANLQFLPGVKKISVGRLPAKRTYDVVLLLECSTPARAGELGDVLDKAGAVVNIDHHRTFEPYGDVNYVVPTASSTAELVAGLLSLMGVKLTPAEATCLYTGVATDTGRFHYPSTTGKTMHMAASLLEAGAEAAKVNTLVYSTKPLAAVKLLGRALENLSVIDGGKAAITHLTSADFKDCGAQSQHTEDIVNYGLMVPGTEVSVLFREEPEKGRTAVNFRSKGRVDVSKVAKLFGGGGHKNAAGLKSSLPLREIEKKVLAALRKEF